MSKHAEEPWRLSGEGKSGQILSAKGGVVANFGMGGIDARRTVACVNACEGISTEILEAMAGSGAFQDLVRHGDWSDIEQ